MKLSLRKKCPYSEFFCYVFSRICTENGDLRFIKSKCAKVQTRKNPNTDTFHTVHVLKYKMILLSIMKTV